MREQLAKQVVEALGWLLKTKEIVQAAYDAAVAKSVEALQVLPVGLVPLKDKPVPSLTVVCDDVSALLINTLDGLMAQWEHDAINAMTDVTAVGGSGAAELLVDLGTFAARPLAKELRVLLMQRAQNHVNQAAKELGFQLHKTMSMAHKQAAGAEEDESAALMPTSGKVASSVQLVQRELARLLRKLRSDLNSKLESKVAGRFLSLTSKLLSEVAGGEKRLGDLETKAQEFEKQLWDKLPKDE